MKLLNKKKYEFLVQHYETGVGVVGSLGVGVAQAAADCVGGGGGRDVCKR